MKLISIRLYLILALALIVIVAILSSGSTDLILTNGTNVAEEHSALVRPMMTNSRQWTDPAWQRAMNTRLSALNMIVMIRGASGHVIYQSSNYNPSVPVYQEIIVTDGTRLLGTASIYECSPTVFMTFYAVSIGLFALLLTLAVVVWFFARTILKPLTAIKKATQQVTQNDLDFHFPGSKVREVAEAFDSFTMMGEALRASLVRQVEVEQERRLLISAVAHDLRTPLFSLRGYLEGLSMGLANTPEKASKYIEVCQTKAAALERLIADLFSYTKLEYLEQLPHQEPLEIGELIAHILESLAPQVQGKNIRFIVDGPAIPCIIQADVHLLTRVFENLLDNALRYTPAGGFIRISWQMQADQLSFTVTDTGPGIAPVDLPHLFTPLYRGDSSRSRHTGGAGLGLSIAQRILHAHGGDLIAANAAGGGAVFTGYLRRFSERGKMLPDAKNGEGYPEHALAF